MYFCIRYDYFNTRPEFKESLFKELMFCTEYAFLHVLEICAKYVEGHFFLVYSVCMNFFHLNFPLHDIFFCTSPAPPADVLE